LLLLLFVESTSSGFIGITNVESDNGFGEGALRLVVKQKHNFDILVSILSLIRQPPTFFANMTVDVSLDSDLNFTGLNFEMLRSELSVIPTVEFHLSLSRTLQSYDDYIDSIREFTGGWNVSFGDEDHNPPLPHTTHNKSNPLRNLANIRSNSLCYWMVSKSLTLTLTLILILTLTTKIKKKINIYYYKQIKRE
jgi:hypothetical protein